MMPGLIKFERDFLQKAVRPVAGFNPIFRKGMGIYCCQPQLERSILIINDII